ncbi:MAG: SPFH domain-containing protein [Ruminococcus flavefaciens]|nr:SPFH domain-containing protein [Ruminococcus flavefaciens]
MGLFHKNNDVPGAFSTQKNIMESIQREQDTDTLIYLDSIKDFNTNSVITVAPNEQVIFVKNGEFYGTLPSGRHEIKSENYPVLSRIRNILTGEQSTFTCQVYHVSTSEQNVAWGTSSAIEVQDFFLGGGKIGVPTLIRGAGEFRIRFNINEDDDACKQTFMRLVGDKSTYTVHDLSLLFRAQMSQEISNMVGKALEERSLKLSINAISSQLKDFSTALTPAFRELFTEYGFELINFSFYNLTIDETEERKKYLDRLIATAHTGSYDKAVQQEILKDIAENQGGGGMAGIGAGLGMGMAAGNAFSGMSSSIAQPIVAPPSDPMEVLTKMKQMLTAGLISQQQYDSKVAEIMQRL